MKKHKLPFLGIASALCIGLVFTQCSKEEKIQQQEGPEQDYKAYEGEFNPSPEEVTIPEATVALMTYEAAPYFKDDPVSSLSPATFSATLSAGESANETKQGYILGAPPLGDVLFALDLTGSMGGELNNAKVNSINIMNAVAAVIPDTYFGVVSHKDYPGIISGCGYNNSYGGGSDYPYALNQSLTATNADVVSAINTLPLGGGSDGPESYSRMLYETYADAGIGWRSGTKKIVIAWGDNIPHDCDYREILDADANVSTGPDPGRDATAGTADDLAILDVLQGMADNNITLIVLHSGGQLALWQKYAEATGGTAVQINGDGSIPGGVDIADYIASLILEEVSNIEEISLEVCTPGYEGWVSYIEPFDPSSYAFDPEDPSAWEEDAMITFTVPEGTEDGEYSFDVCLVGDGAEYGRQTVTITVVNTIEIPFDVHPTSCPNPINRMGGGVIPMAILGTDDFDVTQVDVSTIEVLGVAPSTWSIEDVATPYYPFIGKALDNMSCNTYEGDGHDDLTLKFNKTDIAAMLEAYEEGDVIALSISGQLLDGTEFIGEDIIWIIK